MGLVTLLSFIGNGCAHAGSLWSRFEFLNPKLVSPMARLTSLERPRNSAARIVNIMVRVAGNEGGRPCAQVWSAGFDLKQDENGFQIAELLRKLRRELDATENALAARAVPAHLYKYAVDAFRPMLEVSNLSQAWGNIASGVAEHHVMAFRWAAYLLPEEVDQVDPGDLTELKQLLAEFEVILASATIPAALHTYLSEQLLAMKAAIAAVVVSGSSDLKAAVRKAVADVHFSEDDLKAEANATDTETVKEVRSKFGTLFKKCADVAGDSEKIYKAVKLVYDGAGWLALQLENLPST